MDESGTTLFLVSVEGDVPDHQQAALRERHLYPAGHTGMAAHGDTRAGACVSHFNIFGDDEVHARALAAGLLAPFGYEVVRVEVAE
jgi:hypothetical protein